MVSTRLALWRDDFEQFRREGVWKKLAWMLPHDLAKWAHVRVASNVTDIPPSEVTYEIAAKAWDAKRAREKGEA